MVSDAMIFVFWMLSFKSTFSLSYFTFTKRLFSFSSLSVIRVISSAYLRLLIFLPGILIPACASSSPAFLMISAYKLNKQADNIQFSHSVASESLRHHGLQHTTLGLLVHHQQPELAQTHVHWVGDFIQPSHHLYSRSAPAFNLSQHQGLFQWVSSSHQVAKVLGLQVQHQSF